MSSGSFPIPVYNQACLATDSTSTSPSFFLVGSSTPGSLEVNYVNNADATAVNRVATQNDKSAWTPNAAKLCYIYPFTTSANPGITIVQFGPGYNMVHQPVDTDDAMLVVGTYGSYSGNTSQGYTIVFDKSSRGQIFSATGNLLANVTNFVPTVALGMPTVVNMDGITLSSNAIPITMGSVAYILDMDANGTTAIYTINPSASSTLARVYKTGDSLPFSNNMAAAALNNQLLTYSINKTGANFNTFDLTTKTWSGSGLIKADPNPNPTTSVPLGAIIGGVVGGLLVIVLAIVLCIRCRRPRPHPSVEKTASGAELATLCPEMTKMHDSDQGLGYQQQQQVQYIPYEQGQVQYVQVQTPYDQGQGQAHYDSAYGLPSSFIPSPSPPQQPTSSQSPDAAYMTYQPIMEEAGGPSVASTTIHSSSYVSPASYRNSAALLQGGPESTHVKPQRMSVTQHGPQFIPAGYGAGAET
ncbi:hypothetical protein EC957_008877 [Mortierella hygrophila]|uniref:Transmembrane protein n=1 Tax=Mortierella hygrophila TaxID=979708 RepID=A0A9P6EXD2_9FUNG|nr:hypothetical protein EC957_008877 [Mortierella hygrophila]